MTEQYLAHFAVIVLPLFVVQIWSFRKSFYTLPWRSTLMAVYGVGAAIWDQHYTIHIFGIPSGFSSAPIIISFLYGKRWAGLASVTGLISWNLLTHHLSLYSTTISIVLYSIVPFVLCTRYENYQRRMRLLLVVLISLLTIAIQGMTYILTFMVTHPILFHHLSLVVHAVTVKLLPFLGVAFLVQSIITIIPVLLMDNIVEDGKLRLAMVENEHRYQSMLEFNPLGICIIDSENCFVYTNPAYQRMLGYGFAELVGRSRFDLWFQDDMVFAAQISRTVESGEVLVDFPGTLRRKDGNPIEVRFSSIPIVINGSIDGYFSIVKDVTESIQMEEHLRGTEKLSLMGQLAASIAHEIRNPITALGGFLSLMAEQAASLEGQESHTPPTSRYLNIMKDELERINLITSQLLMLGKPQSDQFAVDDLSVIASEVTALLEPQMNMSCISLKLELPDTPVELLCERNQIKQALINVVKNAIEAVGNNGSISVSIKQENNATSSLANIAVHDSGPGISSELLQRLGEPFYTTKVQGTGLGLLVTKRIMQSHNGTIEFYSAPGEGTTVRLAFPLSLEVTNVSETDAAQAAK